MIPQLKSIFNKNQWVQIQNWVNGRLSLKADKFNNANTISTTNPIITYNKASGIISFSLTITNGSTTNCNITNSFFANKFPMFQIYNFTQFSGVSGDIVINLLDISKVGNAVGFGISNNSVSDNIDVTFDFYFTT